ncbi:MULTISPECIES: acyl carrier protein [unclassified Streptomyces]|uniref:acyl carrier protein n=1 Tax=unclassified Streptomyces TaxID=2593676 RepID=UPI0004BD69B8|nr:MULTISPECIES: acyl carrier protein [unclassified Streptomyces]
MNHHVLEIVDELFRDRLQVPELNPDVPLADYGLDSVRSIDLIVEMENRFEVAISDEQAASMRTLREVVDQVTASLTVRAGQEESVA